MSTLGWVDFSSTDREQVSKILAMLREPGTLDELGIGQIRDAFSDLLFPGFSTIQTRAKYLITVPRIFREYHLLSVHKKNNKHLNAYLKEHEDLMAKCLVENHEKDVDGIIGRTMVDKGGVSRRPSSVYWNAFRQFGIIKSSFSLNEFCFEYETKSVHHNNITEHDDGIDDEVSLELIVDTPHYESDWIEDVLLDLTCKEAEFLYRKITTSHHILNSVPEQLFNKDLLVKAIETYDVLENKDLYALDSLSSLIESSETISTQCKNYLRTANDFSLAMEGPHIRYNLLLASKLQYENKTNMEEYSKAFIDWKEEVIRRNIFKTDSADKWLSVARSKHTHSFNKNTTDFIQEWVVLMLKAAPDDELDRLVDKQAILNKGNRSLLKKSIKHNNWVGIRRLDYRWRSAIKILRDIEEGRSYA